MRDQELIIRCPNDECPFHEPKYGIPAIPTTTYVEGTWRDGRSLPARA